MSVYAQKQDLVDRFGEQELIQLTDRADPPSGIISDTVLNRALADADGMIDAALATRYTLPLASVPKILARAACDIARYYLYEDMPGEVVKARYDEAAALLKDLATGKNTLGLDASNVVIPVASGGAAEFNTMRKDFSVRV